MFKYLANLLRDAARLRSTAPGELFPGVEKPTTTLAKMMALTLIEELPGASHSKSYRSSDRDYVTSKFTLSARRNSRKTGDYSIEYFWDIGDHSFPGVTFDATELDIISKAMDTRESILEKKRKMIEAEQRQQKAVDALAAWCKVPEEEKEGAEIE